SGVLMGLHRPSPARSALPVPGAIDPPSTQGIAPASGSGRRRLQGFRWLRSWYASFFKVSLRANVLDATEAEALALPGGWREGLVVERAGIQQNVKGEAAGGEPLVGSRGRKMQGFVEKFEGLRGGSPLFVDVLPHVADHLQDSERAL